jgi:hypothetical protein
VRGDKEGLEGKDGNGREKSEFGDIFILKFPRKVCYKCPL